LLYERKTSNVGASIIQTIPQRKLLGNPRGYPHTFRTGRYYGNSRTSWALTPISFTSRRQRRWRSSP
jgi:hypothetical protein